MLPDNSHKAVCSVTQMAQTVNLSRARFYQLIEKGVFPMPLYTKDSQRPFYPLDLQQQCITIRETGIGHNGRPVLFNRPRKNSPEESQNQTERGLLEVAGSLKALGLTVTLSKIRTAVGVLYPEGLPEHADKGGVIKELYRHITQDCQRSV